MVTKNKKDVFDPLDLVPGETVTGIVPLGDVGIDNQFAPVSLHDIMEQAGILARQVPAVDLVDQTFIITGLKTFKSSFQDGNHCYYTMLTVKDSGEKLATVLGGGAVVDMLDTLIKAGVRSPLEVTLRNVEGGAFGHYYVLE